jgi:hypothetical protein
MDDILDVELEYDESQAARDEAEAKENNGWPVHRVVLEICPRIKSHHRALILQTKTNDKSS